MFRKLIFFLTPLLILTILFLVIVLIMSKEGGKGALQVTSVPISEVFLDGKLVGKTPLCLCEVNQLLRVGEYSIKLDPVNKDLRESVQKINIYKGALTVVDKTFEKEIGASSGSLITLIDIRDKDKSELLIISSPSEAQIILDNNLKGVTPILIDDISASDHEIKILKDGYREKIMKIKTIPGKRVEAAVNLGIRTDLLSEKKTSSNSAELTKKVVILDTPTGFLRVRENDSLNSNQLASVNPGEKFDLISEKDNWYQIKLSDGKLGWVSKEYAKKE